jgi:hypothetical protein
MGQALEVELQRLEAPSLRALDLMSFAIAHFQEMPPFLGWQAIPLEEEQGQPMGWPGVAPLAQLPETLHSTTV